jgi:hypothetical protein
MRHSDANLTANVYTDARQLPTFDAVAGLTWEGEINESAQGDAHIDSHKPDFPGHFVSRPVTERGENAKLEVVGNEPFSHAMAWVDTEKEVVVGTGFEPVKA